MNMHHPDRNYADQPRNPHYEDDIVYVTKHSRWILNSIGIWPAVLEGVGKFLPRIAIGLSNLVLFFTVVQCVLHILLEQKDPLLRLRLLGFACYSLVSLMKYWALTVRKPKIKRCIEQMHADWKQVSRGRPVFEGLQVEKWHVLLQVSGRCLKNTFVKKWNMITYENVHSKYQFK